MKPTRILPPLRLCAFALIALTLCGCGPDPELARLRARIVTLEARSVEQRDAQIKLREQLERAAEADRRGSSNEFFVLDSILALQTQIGSLASNQVAITATFKNLRR